MIVVIFLKNGSTLNMIIYISNISLTRIVKQTVVAICIS